MIKLEAYGVATGSRRGRSCCGTWRSGRGLDALQLLGLLALGAGYPHLAHLGIFVGHSLRL